MTSPYPGVNSRSQKPGTVRPAAVQAVENAEERINAAHKNEKTAPAVSDNSDKYTIIKSKISGFAESSEVLLKVLEEVKDIHPFVGVAVIAFKAVVSLELKRRENDDKVMFLLVKIQELMEVLVQLRAIPPGKKTLDGHLTVEGKLASLCIKIEKDIKDCGNLCDTFSKKLKLLKGPIYEIRLAEMGQTFDERQRELELALLMFTALGVQSHKDALRVAQEDINMLILLRMLQSPEEKECLDFVKTKGGPVKCMQDEAILAELIQMRRGTQDYEETEQDGPIRSTTQQLNIQTQTYASRHPDTYTAQPVNTTQPTPYSYSPRYQQQQQQTTPDWGLYSSQSAHQRPTHQSHSTWQQQPHPTHPHRGGYRPQTEVQEAGAYPPPSRIPSPSPYPPSTLPYPPGTSPYPPGRSHSPRPVGSAPYASAYHSRTVPGPFSSVTPHGTNTTPTEIGVKRLQEELGRDLDEELSKNLTVFLRKFDEQRRQLVAIERAVVKQGDRVVRAVREGAHDRIHDRELREIWKEMGWKLVVPATEFVLTLHDYFVAQHHDMTVLDEHFNHPPAPGSTTADQEMAALSRALKTAKLRSEEKWALKSLHFSKLQQVSEAFDADSSGYVSVWEANQVLSLRPSGWSLLQWLAYWASGRHWTISEYRLKIAYIIQDIDLMLRHSIRLENRYTVDRYLNATKTLDRVLSSTQPCLDPPQGELAERVSRYTQQEEERMEKVLKALNYEIDGPDTIELITSRYQIERNFFPLVYLLLRRHFAVIRLACDVALDSRELQQATKSLKVIFRALKSRVATLELMMPQTYSLDLEKVLQGFAFGMYYSVYMKQELFYPPLLDDRPLSVNIEPAPLEWLTRGLPPPLENVEREFYSLQDPVRFEKCIGKYMNGYWTGYLVQNDGQIRGGMLQFRISNWKGSTFEGEGCFFEGIIRIEGSYDYKKNILVARIVGAPDNGPEQGGTSDLRVFITGSLETIVSSPNLSKQYFMTAVWGESKDDRSAGSATFSQTPAWTYQFRKRIPGHPAYSARERWNYALQAVLYRVKCQRGVLQRASCIEKLNCIRRSVYLLKQQYFIGTGTADDEEEVGLTWLPPSDSRLCRWLARFAFWPTIHFNAECHCTKPVFGHRLIDIPFGNHMLLQEVCTHYEPARPWMYGCRIRVSQFLHRRDVPGLVDVVNAAASYIRSVISVYLSRKRPPVIRVRTDSSSGHGVSPYPLPALLPQYQGVYSPGDIEEGHPIPRPGTTVVVPSALPSAPSAHAVHKSKRRVRFGRAFMSLLPKEEEDPSRRRRQSEEENLSFPPLIQESTPPNPVYNAHQNDDREPAFRCPCCNIEFPNKERSTFWACLVCTQPGDLTSPLVMCNRCELLSRPCQIQKFRNHSPYHPLLLVDVPDFLDQPPEPPVNTVVQLTTRVPSTEDTLTEFAKPSFGKRIRGLLGKLQTVSSKSSAPHYSGSYR